MNAMTSTAGQNLVFALSQSLNIETASDVRSYDGTDFLQLEAATISLSFLADRVGGIRGLFSRDATGYQGGSDHLSVYIQNGTLVVRLQADGSDKYLKFEGVNAGQEYDIALSFDGTDASLSVDGNIVDTVKTGLTWEDNAEDVQIGGLGWHSRSGEGDVAAPFDGVISNVAIYGEAGANVGAPTDEQTAPVETTPAPVETTPAPVEPAPVEPAPVDPAAGVDGAAVFSLANSAAGDVQNYDGDNFLQLEEGTISLSFSTDDVVTRAGLISRDAQGYRGDGNHFSMYVERGHLHVRLQDGQDNTKLIYRNLNEGETYDVAVTFDGDEARLYVNGDPIDRKDTSMTWETTPEDLQVGALGWTSDSGDGAYSNAFTGQISDVAIFDSAFTPAEVNALVNGAPAAPSPAPAPAPTPTPPITDPAPIVEDAPDETPPAAEIPQTPEDGAPEDDAPEDDAPEDDADGGETPPSQDDGNTPADPPNTTPGDVDTDSGTAPTPVFALNETLTLNGPAQEGVKSYDGDDLLQLSAATIHLSFDADVNNGKLGLISRDAFGYRGDGNHFSMYLDGGNLIVRLQHEKQDAYLTYRGIETGKLYNAAVTFNGYEAQLIVGGQVVDTTATGMTWATTNEDLQIGALGWMSDTGADDFVNAFDGDVSNVTVFDKVLSTDEIAALASETPAPAPSTAPTPPAATPAPDPVQDDSSQNEEPSQASDPAPAPAPAPVPVADDTSNADQGGSSEPLPAPDGDVEHGFLLQAGAGRLDVSASRVSTLDVGDNVASLEILDKPDWGNATVNPDNTIALVLTNSAQTGNTSLTYKVTYDDGSSDTVTQSLRVTPAEQALGWGTGDYYMLETDEDDRIVVEHGDNHREVYVSNSDDALSLADIAAMEDLSVNQITSGWLVAHPEYGGDPSMALTPEAGMSLWNNLTSGKESSHHLLFERGYTYDEGDVGRLVAKYSSGESELNPLYFGAYGEGAKPVIDSIIEMYHGPYENLVFQDLHIAEGTTILRGENILFDNITATDGEVVIQNIDTLTFRNSSFYDIHREDPAFGAGNWEEDVSNRYQGLFVSKSDHVLIEGLFVDHAGWEDDYRYDLGGSGGQPPSIFSHNIYLQYTNTDVTLRDMISTQAASFGAQVRSGGFIENNLFIDGNASVNALGGDYEGAGPIGNYTLFLNNLITDAGGRETAGFQGALSMGIVNAGEETALVDNIVAHLADPNNPSAILDQSTTHPGVNNHKNPYFDDTIIYNWTSSWELNNSGERQPDQNTDGLNESQLDQTTIQLFTAALLGQDTATVKDFANYLIAQDQGLVDGNITADDVLDYFNAAFGIEVSRTDNMTLRFVPDDRGDGVRWDNSLNWDSEDAPIDGDSIDLAGNWVEYGGTIDIENLDFGDGGQLNVGHGRLNVNGEISSDGDGGLFTIDDSGQVWAEGYDDDDTMLDIEVDGGRFANTAKFNGLFDLIAKDGQTLLGVDGAEMVVEDGSKLTIDGSSAEVGFDGEQNGVSLLEIGDGGTLEFIADTNGIATIEEFRSGALDDDAPKVLSAFDMGEGTLLLDITELRGKSVSETLVEADEIVGMFDDVQIVGLANNQNATLTFDYDADTITLSLTAAGQGNGQIDLVAAGNMDNAAQNATIWDVLTDGQGFYEELDETVDVNGREFDEDDILAA